MRIKYLGQLKDSKENTRCASISWNGEKEKENKLAYDFMDYLDKFLPMYNYDFLENEIMIEVNDQEDYESIREEYKIFKQKYLKSTCKLL